MGNKCFRPVNQGNQPVYIGCLNNSLIEAAKICQQKKQLKQNIIEDITKVENRKGYLKKLFDHLLSHHNNIIPAIKYCNKRISQERTFSCLVIGNIFCQKLVQMISEKRLKFQYLPAQQHLSIKKLATSKSLMTNQFDFRNLLHQIQSHFFQLVIKILVYNSVKNIQNTISQNLVSYSNACGQKLTAKKQLKIILDMYLTIIFQKDIQLISKQSYLPFYAYSILLAKSKTDLFTADFIQKHFKFILKLFFELQDCKTSNQGITQSEQFSVFQDCVSIIVKEFVLFSTENKKIQGHIINQIMLQLDIEKFEALKAQKLQKLIRQNLNPHNREHFMFDWLRHLIPYIAKRNAVQQQGLKDSRRQYTHDILTQTGLLINSLKNIKSMNSRFHAIQTLKRWFVDEMLNIEKTMKYCSQKIFQALLINLYNANEQSQMLFKKAEQTMVCILDLYPHKISQILCIISKQLRNTSKLQCFYSTDNNSKTQKTAITNSEMESEHQALQNIWKNGIYFVQRQILSRNINIQFKEDEIQQIYSPVDKTLATWNLTNQVIYLAGICLKYVNLQIGHVQRQIYNFFVSLVECMKIPDQQTSAQNSQKLVQKMHDFCLEINSRNSMLLCTFLKHSHKNIEKQDQSNQIWVKIFINTVVIAKLISEKAGKSFSKRTKQLNELLSKIMLIIKKKHYDPKDVQDLYINNKQILEVAQMFYDKKQKQNLKDLQIYDKKLSTQGIGKSITNLQNSAVSSKIQFSHLDPDSQFRNVMEMVIHP